MCVRYGLFGFSGWSVRSREDLFCDQLPGQRDSMLADLSYALANPGVLGLVGSTWSAKYDYAATHWVMRFTLMDSSARIKTIVLPS